jgi:[ribosomal protein S5]-alanine N-acetyltransferase
VSRSSDVPDIYIRPLVASDATALLALRRSNRDYFAPFEPQMPARHFTLAGQRDEIEQGERDSRADLRYPFGVFAWGADIDRLVGRVALSNVARGAWQNATIGYYVDRACVGRGYATRAVRLALRFAFEEASLHRVQGAVIPDNPASARVLRKAGFHPEGRASNYIKIAGRWRDHDIYAITKEDWDSPPTERRERGARSG